MRDIKEPDWKVFKRLRELRSNDFASGSSAR